MTLQPPQKIQRIGWNLVKIWLIRCIGVLEALLLARFVVRLAAARPDHVLIDWLYVVTAPFIQPFAFLDQAQPLFGATLERSTLVTAICIPLLAYGLWVITGGAQDDAATSAD